MEQEFKLRRMSDLMEKAPKEQLVDVFLQVQRHNFVLTNNLSQLLDAWMSHSHPPTTPEER